MMNIDPVDIDDETTWRVQQLAKDGRQPGDAAACLMIEKLRRLEDLARNTGVSRQVFQKIVSARRVVGDKIDLGPLPRFVENLETASI